MHSTGQVPGLISTGEDSWPLASHLLRLRFIDHPLAAARLDVLQALHFHVISARAPLFLAEDT